MIVEFYELWNLITRGEVGGLALFFLSVVVYLVVIKYKAMGFRDVISGRNGEKVSAVVPFFREETELLRACLISIRKSGVDEIICVCDNPADTNFDMVRTLADKLIIIPNRIGKRACLSEGFKASKNELVLLVDSDTVLEPDALDRMIEVMSPDVGGVSCRHHIFKNERGTIQGAYSQIIEDSRFVVDCALSRRQRMSVLDGRCSLYRRKAIAGYIDTDAFTTEAVGGHIFVTGDDRQLTRHLSRTGWNTKVCRGAVVFTAAPRTFKQFLRQQLRWMRSGYHYFIQDVKEGMEVKNGFIYGYHQIYYFFSPILFIAAILYDSYNHVSGLVLTNPILTVAVIVIGCSSISMMRQLVWRGYVTIKYAIPVGVIGLIILLPLSFYAFITRYKEHLWLTR